MNLFELAAEQPYQPATSVPDWMLGFWKRYSISFADGTTDTRTHVCWLQSRNFTIDLRLPLEQDLAPAKAIAEYSTQELRALANYEGWVADSTWDGRVLTWLPTDTSLQVHNRWPEPAILQRVGNCMIEHCDSQSYVEDWRLQASAPGPLIGLRLVHERNLETGAMRHLGGGLIVVGDHAALVLGRSGAVKPDASLREQVAAAHDKPNSLRELLSFETSVADRASGDDYVIRWSTCPQRLNQALSPWDGFARQADGRLLQTTIVNGIPFERLYSIDCLEAAHTFDLETPHSTAGQQWMREEKETLQRYASALFTPIR
jgi:hypothetical protein